MAIVDITKEPPNLAC